MKYLYLDINRQSFSAKTNENFTPYGFDLKDSKAFLESLTITSFNVVDMDVFDQLTTTTQSLVAGDKVYIMPGVTIPRYKIRETGKDIGFDIVRSRTKATKVVYNKKQVIDEMIDKRSEMGIKTADLKKVLDFYYMQMPELDDPDIGVHITLDWSIFRVLTTIHSHNAGYSLDNTHYYTYRFKEDTYEELINDLIANPKTLISDKDVMKQCNGSQPLNAESYNRLVSMFSSHQNQEIALELLCNCDYDQSMVYILKLLSRFNFRGMPGTNHVNYKAFRNYMSTHWQIDPNYYSGDIIDIIRRLAEKDKLKREYLNEFKDEILKHVKTYGENSIFTISAIQMKEEYKQKIVE